MSTIAWPAGKNKTARLGLHSDMKRIAIRLSTLILFLFLLTSCSDELAGNRPYILTTATTGGAYYPIGVAIATIAKSQLQEEHNISLSAISSAGSLENVKLLRDNQAQFGLLQGAFGAWAWHGEGPVSRPQTNLRSIGAMWQNVEHFVLTSDLVTNGTVRDLGQLDGARYVLGARNSGAEQTGRFILETLGIDYENTLNLAYMGYGGAANAIQDGNIVGMNVPAGAPVSAITQAFAQLGDQLTILDFSAEELATINSKYDLWDWYEFPPGTYPNQDKLVRSVASPNVLVARADVPEEVVYHITRVIWENLGALQDIHAATRDMRLDIALKGLGAPLHPGAIRYYREKGLTIPANLLPPES